MCVLATHLALMLHATVIAATGATTGCNMKTCTVDESGGDVTSALAYTEPVAVEDARDARINAATDPLAKLSAEDARGIARVTGESRTFDASTVSVSGDSLSLTSTVTFPIVVEGQRVDVPLSVVRLSFDLPASDGTIDLAAQHAKVCESIEDGASQACGPAAGTLAFTTSKSGFDLDLTLVAPPNAGDGPSLVGSAHVHYERKAETSVCPDLGGPGIFSP